MQLLTLPEPGKKAYVSGCIATLFIVNHPGNPGEVTTDLKVKRWWKLLQEIRGDPMLSDCHLADP